MFFAATIYALGKTFLWPTMLGVVGERFPQSATVAMALMGFAGMTSAGLLGGPGIGYKQDYYASQYIQDNNPRKPTTRVKAPNENKFLVFPAITGIDGAKAGMLEDNGEKVHVRTLKSPVTLLTTRGFKGLKRTGCIGGEANKEFAAEVDAQPVADATSAR